MTEKDLKRITDAIWEATHSESLMTPCGDPATVVDACQSIAGALGQVAKALDRIADAIGRDARP